MLISNNFPLLSDPRQVAGGPVPADQRGQAAVSAPEQGAGAESQRLPPRPLRPYPVVSGPRFNAGSENVERFASPASANSRGGSRGAAAYQEVLDQPRRDEVARLLGVDVYA